MIGLEAVGSCCCFFELRRHIFGAGMAIVEAHFAVLSKACKFMFAVLRDRMPLAAMSFASKVSSDLVLLARQRTAMFVCEEWVISWWRCPYKMVARYFKGSGP